MADPSTASNTSIGAGQQYPDDSNDDFSVIAFIVRQMMAKLDTMKLVKVVKVTGGGGAIAAAGTVDVQLLVMQIDGSNNTVPNGVVHGIPWWRLQGGTSAVIIDPVVGDVGYVACSDRDISNLKAATPGSVEQAAPGSRRQLNVSDGIYVGGVLNAVPDQYLWFNPDGGFKILDKLGNHVQGTADGVEIADKFGNVIRMTATGIFLTSLEGTPTRIEGDALVSGNILLGGSVLASDGSTYAGNIATSGEVVAGTIGLKAHHHTQGVDSHGDTEAPTSASVA